MPVGGGHCVCLSCVLARGGKRREGERGYHCYVLFPSLFLFFICFLCIMDL